MASADLKNKKAKSLSPADVAAAYLKVLPNLSKHREALIEIARVGWSGESPVEFYLEMAILLNRLPWLVDSWVGKPVIDAIWKSDHSDFDASSAWEQDESSI